MAEVEWGAHAPFFIANALNLCAFVDSLAFLWILLDSLGFLAILLCMNNTTTTRYVRILNAEMAACIEAARANGWDGADRDYNFTAEDCESIAQALDDAGMPVVPSNTRSLLSIHDAALYSDEMAQ